MNSSHAFPGFRPLLLATIVLLVAAAATPGPGRTRGIAVADTTPVQGQVVRVEVRRGNVCGVTGRFERRWVSFRHTRAGFVALLGVDLEAPPGPRILSLRLRMCGENRTRVHSDTLWVQPGSFRTEHLTLPDTAMVHPSPEQRRRARRERRLLRDLLASSPSVPRWQLPFRFPLDRYQVGTNFGARRVLNGVRRSPHAGEDFSGTTADTVYSINRGRVDLVRDLFYEGTTVVVDHGGGLHSLYAHLSRVFVAESQHLRAGDPLGRVGRSGRVTGPHLHLSVRLNGARVDPNDLFAERLADPDVP